MHPLYEGTPTSAQATRRLRQLARHRSSPFTCSACGRVVERKARQQKFCSERCRMRGRYFASKPENKSLTGLPCQKHSTNPPKNINDVKANSQGVFGPPCAEVTNAHTWTPATSSSGVASFVTTLRQPALREPTR
jgi:hypothetical protein